MSKTRVVLRLEAITTDPKAIEEFKTFWKPEVEAPWTPLERDEPIGTELKASLDALVLAAFRNRIAQDLTVSSGKTVNPGDIANLTALNNSSWQPIDTLHEGAKEVKVALTNTDVHYWKLAVKGEGTSISIRVAALCEVIVALSGGKRGFKET